MKPKTRAENIRLFNEAHELRLEIQADLEKQMMNQEPSEPVISKVSERIYNNTGPMLSRTRLIVMRLYQNVKNYAFYYTMLCYLLFVFMNLTYLHMPDPYGTAMVAIGSFWLVITKVLKMLNSRYTNQGDLS